MKPIYYPILRVVLTLLVGIAMIAFPGSILTYLATVVGLLFILPGVVEWLRYLIINLKRSRRARRNNHMRFPLLATLSIVVGVIIMCFSVEFLKIFSFVLAVSLIIAGIYEIAMIVRSNVKGKWGFYVMPVSLSLLGIFILSNPLELLPHLIIVMFGVGAVIYAINELIYIARISN